MIPIAKPQIGCEETQQVVKVLQSGNLACGEMVERFEEQFAKYVGTKYAVAVSSGTAALHLALKAINVNRGEVITSALSFIATPNSVLFNQGVPVFCDVDPLTYNIDVSKIENLITSKTTCILPVHLYGNPVQMDWLMEIAEKHNVCVVGDACQAHGACHNHRMVGGFGDMECFSFYPTKNMTCGEGGMVTTNDETIQEKLLLLRNHGRNEFHGGFSGVGFNYRMTDIHAAVGLVQLKKLSDMNWERIKNAGVLTEELFKHDSMVVPSVGVEDVHVFHQYTVQHPHRNDLMVALANNHIGFGVYYPEVLYKHKHLRLYGRKCPIAEDVVKQVISLPVHPSVTMNDLLLISDVVMGVK